MSEHPDDAVLDRRSVLRLAGTGAVAAVAGCGGDQATEPGTETDGEETPTATATPRDTRTEGGQLRVAYESELTGLDPHLTSSVVSWNVVYNVCETLLTFEGGSLAGRLATNWEANEDGTEYTFTLEEGVMFHPPVDREMTAEDVVYSFQRMNVEEAKGGDLAVMESVEATGEYEVTFTLSRSFAPFIPFLARVTWVVVPEEAVEDQGGAMGDFQEPVGTGPFRLEEYEKGDHLTLTAFDDHRYEDEPWVDSVRITPIPDEDSRVLALENDDVDFARGVPARKADSLREGEETKTVLAKATGWGQLHINCEREPWSDPAVRRAVAHAMDREAIVEAGLSGYGEAAWQPYPEGNVWHFDIEDKREYDPDRAQLILEESGNPLEGETLEIKTTGAYQIMDATATVLQQNLEAIGVDAEINRMEWGTMLNDYVTGNYGAVAFSVPFKVDPDRHHHVFIHPDGPQLNGYTEDQPDAQRMYELINEGRAETDTDARVDIYTELTNLVDKNLPWISTARSDDIVGLRADIEGNFTWTLPYNRFWNLSIEE